MHSTGLMDRLDGTLPLAARPYGLLPARARRLHADVFETRLLFRKTICMTGADAARVFYDPERFVRAGAAPRRLRLTLFGEAGVQSAGRSAPGREYRSRNASSPFFPMTAARVARDFEWRGHHFPEGRRVVLDLHGTDHDPRLWERPEEFRPERFIGRDPDAYSLIPQGGGDHFEGHRCAGEWITEDLMKVSVTALTRWMNYSVPAQELRIHPWRAPAIPKSRFIVTQVAGTRIGAREAATTSL